MYCNQCGKMIPDDAKFCNHCGNKVTTVQTQPQPQAAYQPAPQPASHPAPRTAPQPAPAPRPAPQPTPQPTSKPVKKAKKKGFFSRLLSIIITVAIVFAVRYGVEALFSGDIKLGGISASKLTEDCMDGALYENGYLTYGLARLSLPGYVHGEETGDDGEYLISPDGTKIIKISYAFEDDVSYSSSNKQGIQNSYMFDVNYKDVTIEEFSKYKVEGFGVIEYIAKGTMINGPEVYVGELVIFPKNTTNRTMRFIMTSLATNEISSISSVFDTLQISEDFDYTITRDGIVFNSEESITVR